jgi:hypothetical protein
MFNRFLSKKIFASQGPGKYDPDGRFVHGHFVPTDVLSPRTFCLPDVLSDGGFVPTDVLSDGRFVATDVLSPRTFCPYGCFVHGCFVSGHFVWAPSAHMYQQKKRKSSLEAGKKKLEG